MTRRARVGAWLLAAVVAAVPVRASAWDPARTHGGITEQAVRDGGVHRRWMENSGGRLGWFTPLRVDPTQLDAQTRRALVVAMRLAHADVGAVAAGGPGACPPQPAPSETLQRCVEGELWETTALGWLRLGLALEATPRARLLHHFASLEDPAAPRWRAHGRSRATWRRIERQAGGSLAARVSRSGFAGEGPTALAWLADTDDPWAPAGLHAQLRQAALGATPAQREQALALAMVATGALLHVVQDLNMPAFARGDLLGTRVPLSEDRRDRGSPLSEYARITFGRAMPQPLPMGGREPATPGEPAADAPEDLRSLLLGDGDREGVIEFAAGHFLSDGSLPAPRRLDDALSPREAAAALLADLRLDPAEVRDAELAPWPASSGYLRTKNGRALLAFRRDDDGTVQPYLDRRILREHALVLLPRAVQASIATLELLWPAWPQADFDRDADVYELEPLPGVRDAELLVLVETADGRRSLARRVALLPGRSRIRGITPARMPEGAHVVLVLRGMRRDGTGVLIERRLDAHPLPRVEPPGPTTTTSDAPAPTTTTPPRPTRPTQDTDPAVVDPPAVAPQVIDPKAFDEHNDEPSELSPKPPPSTTRPRRPRRESPEPPTPP
ncbi:MAG: hypothetical protein K1X88_23385 [Nannocystaceae bacterium]|nr:hypothetical protein [Nannocystaceae bacterium]